MKPSVLDLGHPYLVAKANANFPGNPALGLPTIQGLILMADGRDGRPLAILDSIEITLLRTAAATAVAAKHLARPNSSVITVCGCGEQSRAQLRSLARVLRIERVYAYDQDGCRSDRLADDLALELHAEILPVDDLAWASSRSDVCVTVTTSTEFLLGPNDVRPGTFIAAVGADNPEKREIHPALMATSKVVVDDLEQCATIGDLHHALEAGTMTKTEVHGDLAAVVAGRIPGRASDEGITIFDSTGVALEDAAAAALVYGRAREMRDAPAVQFAE